VLSDFFIPAILEEEVSDIEDFKKRLQEYKGHNTARAGLEMALWDLRAKAQGKPLAELLGGVVEKVPVGVSIGIQDNADVLLNVVEEYIEKGYKRIKLKIKPGRDVDEVETIRKSYPDLHLQVDANSAYILDDAPIFETLDSFELVLIEQPLAEDDLIDHSRLQARLHTPICLDESIISARHARQALEIDACRVVNIKSARVGGLLESLAVHDLCHEAGVPVWCGGMLETGIGRAKSLALASLPGFTLPGDISATDRYYAEDIAEPRFTLNADSTIDVPVGSGLGVEIVPDLLERFTLRREIFRV
jgi:O-succinylbenzoate synthase